MFVLSDMAYSEIYFDDNPPPSVAAGAGRDGCVRRGQHAVENLFDGGLPRRLRARQ